MSPNLVPDSTDLRSKGTHRPFTAWLSRVLMVPPTLILTMISIRLITDPAHALASKGVALTQPEAVTDTRVVGALSLTLASLLFSAILSKNRLRLGHLIVILTMGLALAVRVFGFLADGTTVAMGDQKVKTIGEVVFLALNCVGLLVQSMPSAQRNPAA